MPNIAIALKLEIARLARKELRSETESLKKAVSAYRSDIAALKRRVQALEKQPKPSARMFALRGSEGDHGSAKHRFSAKGFAKHRERLGLSAADYARLLGVSSLSVYKWEAGQAHPRARYMPAIAEVRTLGKREAAKRLEGA
jgi:DNA-binding XRE family transcriptional regulator